MTSFLKNSKETSERRRKDLIKQGHFGKVDVYWKSED